MRRRQIVWICLAVVLFIVFCLALLITLAFEASKAGFSPKQGDDPAEIRRSCCGLWQIDEASLRYYRRLGYDCDLEPSDHFVCIWEDGRILVHCRQMYVSEDYWRRFNGFEKSEREFEEFKGEWRECDSLASPYNIGFNGHWTLRKFKDIIVDGGGGFYNWRWRVEVKERWSQFYVGEDVNGDCLSVIEYENQGFVVRLINFRKIADWQSGRLVFTDQNERR